MFEELDKDLGQDVATWLTEKENKIESLNSTVALLRNTIQDVRRGGGPAACSDSQFGENWLQHAVIGWKWTQSTKYQFRLYTPCSTKNPPIFPRQQSCNHALGYSKIIQSKDILIRMWR